VAFTRLWNVQDDPNQTVLISHQWIVSPDIYLAPLKQAVVGADGTLRAEYWPGNERLKGEPVKLTPAVAPVSTPITVAECPNKNASGASWSVPIAGGSPGHISLGSMCLGHSPAAPTQVALVPCGSPDTISFAVLTNGSVIATGEPGGGTCLGVSPAAQLVLVPCSAANTEWKSSAGHLQLITGHPPLRPVALWQFEDGSDLGRNTGSGAGPSGSSTSGGEGGGGGGGLVCAGGARCMLATGDAARPNALRLTAESYLEFNGGVGVPTGTPVGNAPYTVAGWVFPDQSRVKHSRRPRVGADGMGAMMGMVGWGDWATSGCSNAFATSLPGGFWNYWFNGGNSPKFVSPLVPHTHTLQSLTDAHIL
jgi:hypothetical protein